MASSYEAAKALFRLGEFGELLRSVQPSSTGSKRTDPQHQILIAEALVLSGDYARAAEFVGLVEHSSASQDLRPKTEMVRGLIASSQGSIPRALEHFRTALRLADEAHDLDTAAWAHVRLFRFMIEGHPASALASALSDARRSVLRAGDAQISAYLHLCVAVLEGQAGRLDEGVRHCEIAEALLSKEQNAWIAEGTAVNRGCIAALGCQLDQAVTFLGDAKRASAKSTLARGRAQADYILGHVLMLKGEFERAEIDSLGRNQCGRDIAPLTSIRSRRASEKRTRAWPIG